MKILPNVFVSRHKEDVISKVKRIFYSLFCLKVPTIDPLPLGNVKGCLTSPNPDNKRKKHRCPPPFKYQVFVSDNRFEVRCMIFHVKMLFVGGGWLVRFSRAISVTVGASATNDRCEGTCKVDSRPASCFVLLCLFSISKRKVLLILSMF